MKKASRFVAVTAFAAVAAMALAGCSSSGDSSNADATPNEVTIFGGYGETDAANFQKALTEFGKANGIPLQHVPFKSPGEASVSLMGGETHALFLTSTQALPIIKSGRARAVAYDYATRADFMPEVPTMTEAGSAPTDLDSGWHGLMGPANLPEPVFKWLETEVRKAIATPDVKAKLPNQVIRVVVRSDSSGTSNVFSAYLAATGKGGEVAFLKGLGAAAVIPRQQLLEGAERPMLKERWAGAVDVVGGETLAAGLKSTGCFPPLRT